MSQELFAGLDADDESAFYEDLSPEEAELRLHMHRSYYIQERDFQHIRAMGLNLVRIPVPHFIFGDCESGVTKVISVPGVYSFMATNDFGATMDGLDDIQARYAEAYGVTDATGNEIDYTPDVMITFWNFRLMIGAGMLALAVGIVYLFLMRKGRLLKDRRLGTIALWTMPLPFLAASFGWIFTEMGRQPWVVAPNLADPVSQVYMLTQDGVSTVVSSGTVLTSMIVFTLLYAALGVVWFMLLRRYVREGVRTPVEQAESSSETLSFAY